MTTRTLLAICWAGIAVMFSAVLIPAAEQLRRAKQLVDVMSGATGVDLWSKAMETP